jgi:hypothetical protein
VSNAAGPETSAQPPGYDACPVRWPARLRFGTRTLLLGLTGIAAAAPLTIHGLVFNAVALALTALALWLQMGRRAFGRGTRVQHLIAIAYLSIAIIILTAPQHHRLCALATGVALLTVAGARLLMAWRGAHGRRARSIAPITVTAALGLIAVGPWPTDAPWVLAFLIAAELVCAGVWALQLGFAQHSIESATQRAKSAPSE